MARRAVGDGGEGGVEGIAVREFVERRGRVLRELGSSVGVVFAGDAASSIHGKWHADAMFRYLTGIDDEPGAAVLFDPKGEDERRRCVLFLKPRNPDLERWDGARPEIDAAMKAGTGFAAILRTTHLPRALTVAARRAKRVACLHDFAVYEAPVTPDLAVFRKVLERVPGVAMEDRTQLLQKMRAIKSPAELRLMRAAASATAAGFAAALAAIRPGALESAVQGAFEEACRGAGGSGNAYEPIVGSGLNGTVLHYKDNDHAIGDDELIVIDAGSQAGPRGNAYASDVTRTYPSSGRFSGEQREVYEAVLAAQAAAIKAVRPGARMWEVDAAARAVIEKAGFGDAFIHGIGHHLGLEVHDVTPDGALEPGMVVTIEPGVYLPDRAMGVRIEDDILVGRGGRNENLTESIPKAARVIETLMASARAADGRANGGASPRRSGASNGRASSPRPLAGAATGRSRGRGTRARS